MKTINDRLVVASVLIRVILIFVISSGFAINLYSPFFKGIQFFDLDPWGSWIEGGGREDSLPYGLVLFFGLYIVFGINSIVSSLVGFFPETFVFSLFILIIDLYIYRILKNTTNSRTAILYLASPIVIYVNFIIMQSDALVGLFLMLFSINLLARKLHISGLFLGLAVGSKFGVLIIIPFLLVFAISNERFRRIILKTVYTSVPVIVLSYIPALWSNGFRTMVFGSEKISQIYSLSIKMSLVNFYVFPAIYLLLILWIWRSRRSNLKILIGFMGVALFLLGISSLDIVGWHLWGLSSILIVFVNQEVHIRVFFVVLQLLVILRYLLTQHGMNADIIKSDSLILISDMIFTCLLILAIVWVSSTLKYLLQNSDLLRLNKKPILVSICGDSGVGKDTIAISLAKTFGKTSTSIICGDSFHKFERGHNSWHSKTHLNPRQNELYEWEKSIISAKKRIRFLAKQYDHTTGKFTARYFQPSNDLVISQGLHALAGSLSSHSELRVFLQMEEKLRTEFKLSRDTTFRKQTSSNVLQQISNRKNDFKLYIQPQKKFANLIVDQLSGSNKKSVIDEVIFTFSDYEMATRVYKKTLPFIRNFELRETKQNSTQLRITQVDKISKVVLFGLLKNSLNTFDELDIQPSNLSSGSIGLIASVCLFCIEYLREVSFE